jgi:cation transporter-like permease
MVNGRPAACETQAQARGLTRRLGFERLLGAGRLASMAPARLSSDVAMDHGRAPTAFDAMLSGLFAGIAVVAGWLLFLVSAATVAALGLALMSPEESRWGAGFPFYAVAGWGTAAFVLLVVRAACRWLAGVSDERAPREPLT